MNNKIKIFDGDAEISSTFAKKLARIFAEAAHEEAVSYIEQKMNDSGCKYSKSAEELADEVGYSVEDQMNAFDADWLNPKVLGLLESHWPSQEDIDEAIKAFKKMTEEEIEDAYYHNVSVSDWVFAEDDGELEKALEACKIANDELN